MQDLSRIQQSLEAVAQAADAIAQCADVVSGEVRNHLAAAARDVRQARDDLQKTLGQLNGRNFQEQVETIEGALGTPFSVDRAGRTITLDAANIKALVELIEEND